MRPLSLPLCRHASTGPHPADRPEGRPARQVASILFCGPCNLRCPHCIGRQLDPAWTRPHNLHLYPLRGIETFVSELRRRGICELSLTGTNTDPQLYRHEARLLHALRQAMPALRISLHTNGLLALRKMEVLNTYDRVTLSVPSLHPETCRAMTGSRRVLDLQRIAALAHIPLKVSILVTGHNQEEIPLLLTRCRELGVHRVVLRNLYGETHRHPVLSGRRPARQFAGNPVYELDGLEVTWWCFERTDLDCLNLFSDGSIVSGYELARLTRSAGRAEAGSQPREGGKTRAARCPTDAAAVAEAGE